MSQPKKKYEFSEGVTVYGETDSDGSYVVLEVNGNKLRFSIRWDEGRSKADQLRRAIQLVETDLYYDPQGNRLMMVNADTVD